jgi:GTPase involved in cell partitioning and DNA repair
VVQDFKVIMNELASFGADLEKKPMIVVASKIDVANPDKLAALRKYCKKVKLELYEISAVTGKGIPELKYGLGKRVVEIRTGTYASRKPARKKAVSVRKARKKVLASKRIPKRAAFKKRKSR